MSVEETFLHVSSCIRAGQSLEARGTPESLVSAVSNYDEAIVHLRRQPESSERVRAALGIALMNRGNALQKQFTPDALKAAVSAYDDAIVYLRTLPLEQSALDRNTLGAAWMNRGHAQLARDEPESIVASIQSFREAVIVLRTLPLDGPSSFRMNLAASLMNEANALVKVQEPIQALESALAAMAVTAPTEKTDPILADIGLKARRVGCEALGHRLFAASQRGGPTKELGDQASDLVDEGLALARHWESQGQQHFRYIAARLFRFGSQLYAAHLPDFLAEFILEHLDPEISPGAMAGIEEFHVIASETLRPALQGLETRRAAFLDTPETKRLLQRFRDLRAASLRLEELRAYPRPS
jgi:hypothetical protein